MKWESTLSEVYSKIFHMICYSSLYMHRKRNVGIRHYDFKKSKHFLKTKYFNIANLILTGVFRTLDNTKESFYNATLVFFFFFLLYIFSKTIQQTALQLMVYMQMIRCLNVNFKSRHTFEKNLMSKQSMQYILNKNKREKSSSSYYNHRTYLILEIRLFFHSIFHKFETQHLLLHPAIILI